MILDPEAQAICQVKGFAKLHRHEAQNAGSLVSREVRLRNTTRHAHLRIVDFDFQFDVCALSST